MAFAVSQGSRGTALCLGRLLWPVRKGQALSLPLGRDHLVRPVQQEPPGNPGPPGGQVGAEHTAPDSGSLRAGTLLGCLPSSPPPPIPACPSHVILRGLGSRQCRTRISLCAQSSEDKILASAGREGGVGEAWLPHSSPTRSQDGGGLMNVRLEHMKNVCR